MLNCKFIRTNIPAHFDNLWSNANTRISPRAQAKAVEGLIRRLLPNHADAFEVCVDFSFETNGKSSFQVHYPSKLN